MQRWVEDEAVQLIVQYVQWCRGRYQIVPIRGRKPELSCEMFGDFRQLLDRQLLTTPEFEDGWLELRLDDEHTDPRITEGVLIEITNEIGRSLEMQADPILRSLRVKIRKLTC